MFNHIGFIINFINGILQKENLEFFCSITSDSSFILSSMELFNNFLVIFRSFSSSSSEFFFSSFLNLLTSLVFSTAINSKQRLIFLENGFTFLESVIWNSYPFLHFFSFIIGIFLGRFQCFSFKIFYFLNDFLTLLQELANFVVSFGSPKTFSAQQGISLY